ncbi:MAG: ferritin family protein [Thermodesulfobacteriota bacterium]
MRNRGLFVAILIAALFAALPGAFAAEQAKTLDNLQAAFNGESNANAKYLAFAQKAQEEGYGEVASLFRAAARAEEVHLKGHAAVIKKMGAEPKADIKTPEVKSTKENLQAAIEGETYEKTTMYPEFITVAKAEKNEDALRSFRYAKTAEAEHARLYGEALKNLDSLKGSKAKDFYVCRICGYTVTVVDFTNCPSCGYPKEEYEKVS